MVLGFRVIVGDRIGGDESGVIAKSRAGTDVGVFEGCVVIADRCSLARLTTFWGPSVRIFHSTARPLIHLWSSILFGLLLCLVDPVAACVPHV